MTSIRASLRAAALMSVLGVFVLCTDASASDDEADYSAPYLVVENGELVTRYPAKTHELDESKTDEAIPANTIDTGAPSWLVPAALIAVIAGGLLFARVRR